jgi:hypothetical protein
MRSECKWLVPFALLLAASAARELKISAGSVSTHDLVITTVITTVITAVIITIILITIIIM